MAIKYRRSQIYTSLPIALLMGCQSNVHLPKQLSNKVVEEEQITRAFTAMPLQDDSSAASNSTQSSASDDVSDTLEIEKKMNECMLRHSPPGQDDSFILNSTGREHTAAGESDEEYINKLDEQEENIQQYTAEAIRGIPRSMPE